MREFRYESIVFNFQHQYHFHFFTKVHLKLQLNILSLLQWLTR